MKIEKYKKYIICGSLMVFGVFLCNWINYRIEIVKNPLPLCESQSIQELKLGDILMFGSKEYRVVGLSSDELGSEIIIKTSE
jgi:hypothetical protein